MNGNERLLGCEGVGERPGPSGAGIAGPTAATPEDQRHSARQAHGTQP